MFSEISEGLQNYPEKAREEFIRVAEYLLFFASFEPVITPFGLTQQVAENVGKGKGIQIPLKRNSIYPVSHFKMQILLIFIDFSQKLI